MDELTPLLAWVFDRKDQLGLEVREISSTGKFLMGVRDYEVFITIDGNRFSGRGACSQAFLALEVAFTEAFERSVVARSDLNSTNGVAAHPLLEKACASARNELVERDLFLCHYLTKTAMLPLDREPVTFDWLRARNCTVHYRLARSSGLTLVMAVAQNHGFGAVTGLGVHEDEGLATHKAMIECLWNVLFLTEKGSSSFKTAQELMALARPTPEDQLLWSFCPDSWQGIEPLLKTTEGIVPALALSESQFGYRILHKPAEGCPLFVVQCTHPEAQNLFFGASTTDKVNLPRLRHCFGRSICFKDINPIPHPIG